MRNRPMIWGVFTVVLSAASTAHAQNLRLTVEDAITLARRANLASLASRKEIDVARAGVKRSEAWVPSNPYVGVGSTYRPETGGRPNIFGLISQEFELGGQSGPRRESAQSALRREKSNIQQEELSLVANVKTTFTRILINRERVSLARQTADLSAESAHKRAEEGPATTSDRIDLNNANILSARARRDLAGAETTLEDNLDLMRRLLDLPADAAIDPVGGLDTKPIAVPALAVLVERAKNSRPDLQAFREAAKVADAQLRMNRRQRIPNVTVSASYSRFDKNNYFGGDLGFSLPVTSATGADIAEAQAGHERADLELQDIQKEVEREVRESWRAYTIAAADLVSYQDSILPLSEENVRLQKRLVDRDEANVIDLLSQQLEFLGTQRDYLEVLERYTVALNELERVSGGSLTESPGTKGDSPAKN